MQKRKKRYVEQLEVIKRIRQTRFMCIFFSTVNTRIRVVSGKFQSKCGVVTSVQTKNGVQTFEVQLNNGDIEPIPAFEIAKGDILLLLLYHAKRLV